MVVYEVITFRWARVLVCVGLLSWCQQLGRRQTQLIDAVLISGYNLKWSVSPEDIISEIVYRIYHNHHVVCPIDACW
jgi:hypothetical protein